MAEQCSASTKCNLIYGISVPGYLFERLMRRTELEKPHVHRVELQVTAVVRGQVRYISTSGSMRLLIKASTVCIPWTLLLRGTFVKLEVELDKSVHLEMTWHNHRVEKRGQTWMIWEPAIICLQIGIENIKLDNSVIKGRVVRNRSWQNALEKV